MSEQARTSGDQKIFRKTNARPGRHVAVTPENSSMRHLAYARIRLDPSVPSISFRNANRETGLICLSGRARVKAAGQEAELGHYDAMYVPRGCEVEISSDGAADVAEFSCDVEGDYPAKVVRYADLDGQPGMRFATGVAGASRQVSTILGKNVAAGRLLLGFTHSDPGNWTSWPPHEHAAMLEEIYVYFEMPAPAYGIQLVYNDTQDPELVTVVRDGDAVLLPSGYHPNVSVPGHRIAFLWAMAAHREVEDRQYGVFNVQPEFKPPAPPEGRAR
jgi:5-deoxy-glucuronate isomerase